MSQEIHAQLAAAGADATLVDKLAAAGIRLSHLLELVVEYGPSILAALARILPYLPK